MMKANEKKYNFLMTETRFQHVSMSKFSCILFIDWSVLPMIPLAADTVQGSMVTNGTNGKTTSGTTGGSPNGASAMSYEFATSMTDW